MKRIHLFEIEDLPACPAWLRDCLSPMVAVMHKLLGSAEPIADLAADILKRTKGRKILDLCSGDAGPMPDVLRILQEKHGFTDLEIELSDLFPHDRTARRINAAGGKISYRTEPMNATEIPAALPGLRTMISSFHHMRPENARKILRQAKESRQPILVFELSDNSFPAWLWWAAVPFNIISGFFVGFAVRPYTWQQFVFTWLLPIIPLAFAWDGAVSNARTYTLSDLDELLADLRSEDYIWETGSVKVKANMLYLKGLPVNI